MEKKRVQRNQTKQKDDTPNLEQLLDMLYTKEAEAKANIGRHPKYGISFEQAAIRMNTTAKKLKKLHKAHLDGTIGEQKWHAGRPFKPRNLSNKQLNSMVAPATLQAQAGYNIRTRAADFNKKFNLSKAEEIKAKELRQLYHGAGITNQKIQAQRGGPVLPSPEEQEVMIQEVIMQFDHLAENGFRMVMADEATFSVNSFDAKTWAYAQRPITYEQKWGDHKQVLACAVIDGESGVLVMETMERSEDHKGFDRFDMIDVLKKLRDRMPEGNIALFWDNATIHKAKDTLEEAERLFIIPFYNIPYRPEYNGTENLWGYMKKEYRTTITNLKANQLEFSNLDVVRGIVDNLDKNLVKKIANDGWVKLQNARVLHQQGNVQDRGFELHSQASSTFNMADPQEQEESSDDEDGQIMS